MAEPNRRNDIGSKVLISVVGILISIILTVSIVVASKADDKANLNTISITKVETTQQHIMSDVKEIKGDVKEIMRAVIK